MQKHDVSDSNRPPFPGTSKFEHIELSSGEIQGVDSSSEGIRAIKSDDFYIEIDQYIYSPPFLNVEMRPRVGNETEELNIQESQESQRQNYHCDLS